jgi:glutamate-ammonia-ligase adenylyltransferase
VRRFVKTRFTVDSLASERVGNVIDIIINIDIDAKASELILKRKGFLNVDQAVRNIRSISQKCETSTVSRVLLLAIELMSQYSDPDMALNNFERFLVQRNNFEKDMAYFLEKPKSLEMIVGVFSTSQFLSDTLIQNPEYFEWCTNVNEVVKTKSRIAFHNDTEKALELTNDIEAWRSDIRNLRRREILRIALRDLMLNVTLRSITKELSYLAEAIISKVLDKTWEAAKQTFNPELVAACKDNFCILALGKLGASELNYSSDIDLIAVLDDAWVEEASQKEVSGIIEWVLKRFLTDLTEYTKEGFVYRVDFNLRPYGSVGDIFSTQSVVIQYYLESASAWEIQALIKARPVAGSWPVGFEVIYSTYQKARKRFSESEYKQYIQSSRKEAVRRSGLSVTSGLDIKNGEGGIRDIEFLVQCMQVTSPEVSTLRIRSTLDTLRVLTKRKLLKKSAAITLRDAYLFFRRVEHTLQLHQDRQTHALPKQSRQLEVLAKRVLGNDATESQLMKSIKEASEKVSKISQAYFKKGEENE